MGLNHGCERGRSDGEKVFVGDVGSDSRDCIVLYFQPVLKPMSYDWA